MLLELQFVILLGWIILAIGFWIKDFTIVAFSAFYLMALGLDILTQGSGIPQLTLLVLGSLHIGIGFYVLFRAGIIEQLRDKRFDKEAAQDFRRAIKKVFKKIRRNK